MDDNQLRNEADRAVNEFVGEAGLAATFGALKKADEVHLEQRTQLLLWKLSELQNRIGLWPAGNQFINGRWQGQPDVAVEPLLRRIERLEANETRGTPGVALDNDGSRLADMIRNFVGPSWDVTPGTRIDGLIRAIAGGIEFAYGGRVKALEDLLKNSQAIVKVAEDRLREVGLSFDSVDQLKLAELQKTLAEYRQRHGELQKAPAVVHRFEVSTPPGRRAACGVEATHGDPDAVVNCDLCLSMLNPIADEAGGA